MVETTESHYTDNDVSPLYLDNQDIVTPPTPLGVRVTSTTTFTSDRDDDAPYDDSHRRREPSTESVRPLRNRGK